MAFEKATRCGVVTALLLAFAADSAGAQTLGRGGSKVQGSAGPGGSSKSAPELLKCEKPLGSMAIAEPQNYSQQALSRFGLPSPNGLIRLMIQQSNCFQVVERGMAMQNILQERQLQAGGQLQSNSNIGQGQMVAADYLLTPDVVFSENNAGGAGAALGFLPGAAGVIGGAIGGGLKFKTAQTSMLVADARTSLQVAAASGSARSADFGLGGMLGGGGVGGALGAYENTNEGKVVAASFLDNWNNIVVAIRDNPQLSAERAPQVAAGVQAGDVLVGKIKGVKVFAQPNSAAKVVSADGAETVYLGEESNGFYKVAAPDGEGWVQKVLVNKK